MQAIFGTVAAVYADGLTVTADGAEAPTARHCRCCDGGSFQAGDRVLCLRIGGELFVVCRVGVPG